MQASDSDFGGAVVRDDGPPSRLGPIETAFIRRFTHVLERVARAAPPEVLQDALAAPDGVDGLVVVLEQVGATLPPQQSDPLTAARMRAVRIKRELLEQAGGAYTTGQVAHLLGVSPQAIHGRRTRGTLLALRAPNGEYLYPAFQFTGQGVMPGLVEVLSAFQVDSPWTRLSVLLGPAGRLGGLTPLQALADGRLPEAVEAVTAYGEHLAD